MNKRIQMLASMMQRAIGEIVQRELRDPRLGFVTITSVELSPDGRYAKVYASILGDEEQSQQGLRILKNSAGLVKAHLKPVVKTRYMPHLEFMLDPTARKAERIEQIIHDIHTSDDSDDTD
jgi:ribosome-binding factor A